MSKEIFRQKCIDRVSSPEQLNNYIRVTTSSVWMVLIAIIILLLGVCVWGIFGRLDTIIKTGAVCSDGNLICYVTEEDAAKVSGNMTVTVNGNTYTIDTISTSPVQLRNADDYLLHIGNYSDNQWVFEAIADTDLADGIYEAAITIESVRPMSFVLN